MIDKRGVTCERSRMPIPRVIHQLWKDSDVPERFRGLCESWGRRNPGWERRLWTDADLLALVETRYPDWREAYLAYPEAINRADIGRYLVLRTFGGVYADLDCECLRPIEPLLAGAEFAVGLEPAAHGEDQIVAESGLAHVVCASFIASAPGHPYWEAVLARIGAAAGAAQVIERTGPFLLTRAYADFADERSIRLARAEQVYPFSKFDCWLGRVHDIELWEKATRKAFVAHYWEGGWFRVNYLPLGLPWEIQASVNRLAREAPADTGGHPFISCLMASSGVLARARPAIEDYLAQTYANRELVIGAARPQAALADFLRGLARSDVRLVALPDAGPGPLPAALIAAAGGDLVCGWDEDTAHDPHRLEVQQRVRSSTRAAANFLRRQLIWQPASGRIGVSGGSAAPGSILGPRAALAELADAPSQAAWLEALGARVSAAAFNLPRLLVQVARDDDPAARAAFETAWAAAATRFAPERTVAVVEELSSRMRLDDRAGAVGAEPPAPAIVVRRKVLLLTPMKNARAHLPTYFRLLGALEADGAQLSIGVLESDSSDGTHAGLVAAEPWLHRQFARVTVLRQDYGFHPTGARWAPEIQRRRREILARSRNRLLTGALDDEDWVLWLDADLCDYPPDLLARLAAVGKTIVTPNCVRPDGAPFDLNTFCFAPGAGGRDDPAHLRDGLFQPPRGHRRLYLDAFEDQAMVRVDSVGGTALLIRADLHREGLIFPPYSHRGYIETEGLAMMAQDMGQACYALPQLKIIHPDT